MIPQLPTDNLYKFATLGGIVLLVFSVWSMRENSVLLDSGATSYSRASNDFLAMMDELDNQSERLQVDIDRVKELIADANKPENVNDASKALIASEARDKLLAAWEMALTKRFEARKIKATTDTQSDEFDRLLKRVSAEHNQIFWFLITGIAITFMGVTSWYFKHQRYQDELLRVQLDNARKSSTVPPSPSLPEPSSTD